MIKGRRRQIVTIMQTLMKKKGNGKGKSGKFENVQEAEVNVAEISARIETDMDWLSPGCKGNSSLECSLLPNRNNEDAILHEKRNMMHMGSEHMEDRINDGPKVKAHMD